MIDTIGTILSNKNIGADFYRLAVRLSSPLGHYMPGQFVMVRIPGPDLFLRRPFSIFDYSGKQLTILYRAVGKGTEVLSAMGKGGTLTVLGPLGKGFSVDKSKEAVLVAGGIGIAGVAALAKRLRGRTTVLFGCSSEQETVLLSDLTDIPLSVATLDGSAGYKGTVVDLTKRYLSTGSADLALYVCGPDGMVRSLMAVLQDRPVPCQVLLEERMACGLGLCFGCVTLTKDEKEPYKRVCKEGPVFDLWELSL